VDFTDPAVLKEYLVHGHTAATELSADHDVEYLGLLASQHKGGDAITCTLGADVYSLGHNGLVFPSARAAECDVYTLAELRAGLDFLITGFGDPVARGRYVGDPRDLLMKQLRRDHNLVVFSGSCLTRAIRSYSWQDAVGNSNGQENPYWGISAEELEGVRLKERERLRLDYDAAMLAGLLSDAEIAQEFTPSLTYIRVGKSEKNV